MAQNNLAVAHYYKKNFNDAQLHAEKAKALGFPVDPRFEEAIAQGLAKS